MTLLALVAIIFFGFATYNLTCAFVDIPTKKTSRMMMLARKQQGVKTEKLLDVYITKIAGLIAPYLKLDKLKRNKLQRALDIAGLELTPEVYTARAWVTAGAVGLCSILMVFLVPLMVPVLIGLAVALWFSTYYAIFKVLEECLHSIRTIQTHNFSHFLHKNLKKPLAEKSDNGFCGEVPLKRNKVPDS